MPKHRNTVDRITNDKVASAIITRRRFVNSHKTLTGGYVLPQPNGVAGQLPYPWPRRQFRMATYNDDTYVVYSFGTPVAWHVLAEDGTRTWWIPASNPHTNPGHRDIVQVAVDRENELAQMYGYAQSEVVAFPKDERLGQVQELVQPDTEVGTENLEAWFHEVHKPE